MKRRARAKRRRVLTALSLLSVVAFAALVFCYVRAPHAGRGTIVRVDVPKGVTPFALAERIAQAKALDHPWAFAPIVWITRTHQRVRPGVLVLRDNLSPHALLRALRHGGITVRVTIPEGFTRFEIARRLEAAGICDAEGFLAATESPELLARHGVSATGPMPSLEGRLFPSTYALTPGTRAEAVVDRMATLFAQRFDTLRNVLPEGFARANGLAAPDGDGDQVVLTLASLIERETGAPDDRTLIASVFWNRLTRGDFIPRLLQSDPTVVYGCLAVRRIRGFGPLLSCGDHTLGTRMPITSAMLADARNPWNTYRHTGLPPTAICNPGMAALRAALDPARTEHLYFIARGEGRSVFADTLDAHQRNVREYLRRGADASVPSPHTRESL